MITLGYSPLLVLLCIVVGATYAAILYFVHPHPQGLIRWLFASLRFVAVTAIALLLLAPMVRRHVVERQQPRVVVLHDVSASVRSSADSAYSPAELVDMIARRCEVEIDSFGNAGATPMGDALREALTVHPDAVVVVSDGISNRGSEPMAVAEQSISPIYGIALGDTTQHRDAALTGIRCNRIVPEGSDVAVELTTMARMLAGKQSRVEIVDDEGQRLATRAVAFEGDHYAATVGMTFTPKKAGLQRFEAKLIPVEGEYTTRNNAMTFFVDVIDIRRKVAIVASAPHPDVAALRRAIESNPNYEVEVVDVADAERGRWKGREECSLVVLHNLPSVKHPNTDFAKDKAQVLIVGMQTDIARFNAMHSGLEIETRRGTRPSDVTAVPNSGFTLFNYDAADAERISLMPPLTAPFGMARMSKNMSILFTSAVSNMDSHQPMVAAGSDGDARRVVIWGEGLWRWRLAEYQEYGNSGSFDRLVAGMVSYAATDNQRERLQVEAPRRFEEDEEPILTAQLFNEAYEPLSGAEITLHLQGDAENGDYVFATSAKGYMLQLHQLKPGTYRYRASTTSNGEELSTSGTFAIESSGIELRNTTANHALIKAMASTTGGIAVGTDGIEELADSLMAMKPILYSHVRYKDFLNLPWLLVAIMALLAVEWVMRKRTGIDE